MMYRSLILERDGKLTKNLKTLNSYVQNKSIDITDVASQSGVRNFVLTVKN